MGTGATETEHPEALTPEPMEENVTEGEKAMQPPPGDLSPDQGPGELEDLDAADAEVKGGGASAGGGGTGPNDIRSQ